MKIKFIFKIVFIRTSKIWLRRWSYFIDLSQPEMFLLTFLTWFHTKKRKFCWRNWNNLSLETNFLYTGKSLESGHHWCKKGVCLKAQPPLLCAAGRRSWNQFNFQANKICATNIAQFLITKTTERLDRFERRVWVEARLL